MAAGSRRLAASRRFACRAAPRLLALCLLTSAPPPARGAGNFSLELQWGTPIFAHYVDAAKAAELKPELLSAGSALRSAHPAGSVASNRGGWHSPLDLHRRKDPPVLRDIRREVEAAMASFWRAGMERSPHAKGRSVQPKLYIREMWMMMLGLGDSNIVHKHPGSIIAGVYYVNVPRMPSQSSAGSIKFRDPRPQTSVLDGFEWMGMGAEVQVNPAEGLMLLWPAWLEHYVEPLVQTAAERLGQGTSPAGSLGSLESAEPESLRIAISFNVGVKV